MDYAPPYTANDLSLPEPPDYSGGSELLHSYSLRSKGRTWLTLSTNGSGRASPVPVFLEGQPICGRVDLDLEKGKVLKGIIVEGGMTVVGEEEIPFLQLKKTLWTPPNTNTKICGKHSWSFDIPLPREVYVPWGKGKETKTYRLPPNFSENAGAVYIDYRLVVTVRRGNFKVNRTLSTSFGYIPKIVAPPPSQLRRLAYHQGLPIFSPEGDPEGWKVLPKFVIQGILFDVEKVEVECTLAIAKPASLQPFFKHTDTYVEFGHKYKLCFAAGSPLPLYLTLKSQNIQALDLLSSPDAIRLELFRSLEYGADPTKTTSESQGKKSIIVSAVAMATFWLRESGEQRQYERRLEGEIELSNALKPTFIFPRLTIKSMSKGWYIKAIPVDAYLSSKLPNPSTLMDEAPPYAATEISLEGLPSYSREPEPLHSYFLGSKAHKWLTLFINGSRRGRASTLPVLREGESMSGRVELDLEKAAILKEITVEVQGVILAEDEIRFLEIKKSLWISPNGNTKLVGKHSWPYDIQLPKEVCISSGKRNQGKTYRLPPNFSENTGDIYIDYRLVVTVRRSALKGNRLLSANFAYIPKIVPDAPSELRRLAYDQELPIFGPEGDPDGWKVLPKLVVRGTLFNVQEVEVECTLAVAKPLQAGTTVLGEDEISFLELKKPLWIPPKANTKLSGKHSWPFDILLPKEVSVPGGGNVAKTYRLPPNFSEKGGVVYIDYRLVVTVRRGTFKANRLLSTNFAYIPNIVPAPPSELRRLAYDQGLPIFSPEGDPEGWKVLPKIVVEGILFDTQQVKVECTLAIAKPLTFGDTYKLCYAARSPLPLYLTLKSENIQALDTLCSPDAVQLHLLRSLGWGLDATQLTTKSRGKKFAISPVSRATFWPREPGEQQPHERKLEGEIELSNALKPSFFFPRLTIMYHLNMLPFTATGFRSTNPDSDGAVLMSEEVEIATQQTPGILPHSNIPPAYKLAERTDYTKAAGYLLRFQSSLG
ncbi:hypothetical protein H0H81_007277 [Sphagnurus paluster]|uniref:Arrestin-like N-terminal domain-containing protein n=1 Tax=Sphagnurus paluster TaxID=117069 RepID=A0A9P7K4K5_9AGAR|nr:hypothetical protein H0H81_007277 [Sphagnurus paluster]